MHWYGERHVVDPLYDAPPHCPHCATGGEDAGVVVTRTLLVVVVVRTGVVVVRGVVVTTGVVVVRTGVVVVRVTTEVVVVTGVVERVVVRLDVVVVRVVVEDTTGLLAPALDPMDKARSLAAARSAIVMMKAEGFAVVVPGKILASTTNKLVVP